MIKNRASETYVGLSAEQQVKREGFEGKEQEVITNPEFFLSHGDLYAPKSVELTRFRGKKILLISSKK